MNRPPRAHDKVEFEDPVGDHRQEEEERNPKHRSREDRSEEGKSEGDGQDDESDRERAEEPVNPIGHDEHASPPDVFLHPREGDVSETQNYGDRADDSLERDEHEQRIEVHGGPPVCAARSNLGPRAIYLSFRMFAFGTGNTSTGRSWQDRSRSRSQRWRSMIVATPMPNPMHKVARPR